MASAQPIDIITKALTSIGVHGEGAPLSASMMSDAFDMLNDLLDQWSNDKQLLYCVQEVIHELTGNQYVYTIGPGGSVGASFTGNLSGNTLTVTALASGALSVGQIISGTGVATGTAITSLGTALGGNGTAALGTYKVNLSQTVPSVSAVGSVISVTVGNPGAYFSAIPTISFSGGGGSGAAAAAGMRFAEGAVSGPSGGTGYTMGDVVTSTTGVGTPASWLVTNVVAGAITGRTFLTYGDFTVLPTTGAAVAGGTGTGATFTFGAGSFQLQSATVTAGGTGYVTTPTVTVQAIASLVQATALAAISSTPGTTIPMTSYAPRPLRINSAFVRVINSPGGPLDYQVQVVHLEQYERLGLKAQPGPWPTAVYYQPSEPLGVLNYWPNPSQGEMHLFCDTIINRFQTPYDTIVFPPGYFMALRWSLAELLIPEYPATGNALETRAMVPEFAARARAFLKRTNAIPQQTMPMDSAITSRRARDAGWILNGGFTQ